MIKKLVNYFVKGLLVFVPAAMTIFAIVYAVSLFDSLAGIHIQKLINKKSPGLVL